MAQHAIVVIGASAGGLAAIETIVAGLPAGFPAAVLVVLHIPPDAPSHLPAILERSSRLPVAAAQDGEIVRPGRVYVAPTDRHLLLQSDNRLRLTQGPREHWVRPSVDALFRSAAETCGRRVIGIVLSGSLDDGTAGLLAIKDSGGQTVVQAPTDAEHPSMPESAINHVLVDYVLPVADMPALLETLVLQLSP